MTKRTKKLRPNQIKVVSAVNEKDGTIRDCFLIDGILYNMPNGEPMGSEWKMQPAGNIYVLVAVIAIFIIGSSVIEYFSIN